MDFFRRLGIFFIGVSLGMVILAFFFKGKNTNFCYLPNCRVLKSLRSKEIVIPQHIAQKGYELKNLKPLFFSGDVQFNKSNTKSDCKLYVIEGKTSENQSVEIKIKSCFSKATILSVKKI